MGTRPEIIKMAPIYFELKNRGLSPVLLHTGQHSDMATSLYELFNIKPDYYIKLDRNSIPDPDESENSSLHDLASLGSDLLVKCSKILIEVNPSIVMVHGDTSSALIMAIAAFYQKRKIAHIEAGLRSYDEYQPFPEEKNRVLIAQLAHWHFAPTERAHKNLLSEGISEKNIHVVGNTIVKAIDLGMKQLENLRNTTTQTTPDLINKLSTESKNMRMILVTMHRRENQDGGIETIAESMRDLLKVYSDIIVIWPVHPNPKVAEIVNKVLGNLSSNIAGRVFLTKPLRYPVLLWILRNAWVVLTDSGGIQEEAVALNTPVLVLRDITERQELIESGAGILIGTDTNKMIRTIHELHEDDEYYNKMRNAPNPFGDLMVPYNICNLLLESYS